MKKVLCILLSIVLVISGLWFIAPKHATADADFAITTPVAGSLKAAGYIDIEWEDASVINEVENYEVYIDGSLMTTTTECKYEFYTTKVYFHKAWVKANFKDGTDHYTKTVRFGVTKKGLAIETNMAAFKIVPKDMGVAWYYNWGRPSYYYNQLYKDLEYVPMVWGDTNIASLRNKIESAVNSNYKYILGYNEPDMGSSAGGCNIDTDTVISLWQHFVAYKDQIKIGSPAYALWSNVSTSKFPTFMAGVENNVDFVCIHCYPADWNGGKAMADWLLKDVIQDTYDRYQKPIWITEYSTSGNGITQDGTAEFVKYFNEGVNQEKYDYVERHSFFSFNADTFGGGLYSYSTGELSKSGEAYAKYGNPEKDYVTGEYVNPRDAEDPTTVAPTESTTAKPTPKPTHL